MAGSPVVGAVYTETNNPARNQLVAFNRHADGSLSHRQTINSGGKGSTQDVGCGPGCPILDSQGAVDVTPGGTLVFVVNAGSDSVTSFRVTAAGLKRVDTAPSGGDLPISLTTHGRLLYVLNTNSGTISGLKFNSEGDLTPIANSTKPIAGAGQNFIFPSGGARQVGFDTTGKQIVVTELATLLGGPPPGVISSFEVNADGTTDAAISRLSATPLPFGFAFTSRNDLIVSEVNDPTGAADGSVSAYRFNENTGVATDKNSLTSGGALPCWVVITGNDKYAYVINTGAGRPAGAARYQIGLGGHVVSKGVSLAPSGTFLWTDPALSRDSRYLYVLSPTGMPGVDTSRIDSYRVGSTGKLTFLGSTPANLPAGASGLDAR